MGAVNLGGGEKSGKSAGQKKTRTGFVLDMTPLVDVAFLLLTFFITILPMEENIREQLATL